MMSQVQMFADARYRELRRDLLSIDATCRHTGDKQPPEWEQEWRVSCAWVADLATKIPENAPPAPIDLASLPKIDGPLNRSVFGPVARDVREFNTVALDRQAVQQESQEKIYEKLLYVSSPFNIAIATALRLAKTTGALRIERAGKKQP